MASLKLTGGTLRSRRVPTPRGRAVRPTPARVKEALFSILGTNVDDARVLDAYAGTGALGFESLSRGAREVTFVEADAPTAQAIKLAASDLGVSDRATVLIAPLERAVARLAGRYDIVFADPPYADAYPQAALRALRARGTIDPQSLIIYEHSARDPAPTDPQFEVVRTERYGAVALAFMRAKAAA